MNLIKHFDSRTSPNMIIVSAGDYLITEISTYRLIITRITGEPESRVFSDKWFRIGPGPGLFAVSGTAMENLTVIALR